MPIFRLGTDLTFPPPSLAEPDGLLAVGGDLSPECLLLAYSQGIFPWFNDGDPLLWWSPMPRCVLLPGDLHLSRSLRKTLRSGRFRVTMDCDFAAVIRACATSDERSAKGTWITAEMIAAQAASMESVLAAFFSVSRCSIVGPTPPRSPWRS